MNSLALGRYTPYNTFTHRLDPRNKLFLTIALMVIIFFQFQVMSTTLVITGIYLILFLSLMFASRVSFLSFLRSLRGMWFLVLFIVIIYVFIPNTGYFNVAFKIGTYPIYWEAFYQSGYIILRLFLMLILMMILTSTTKPMDLTYGLEWYMAPLKVIRFPAHEIAMTISIALRFIPTLLDETARIMKAQSSRGVDFNRGGIFKRFKAIISLIIPLFVSAIERSEELANAMQVRGYNPRAKRTRFHILKFRWADMFAFLFVILLIGGVITLFVFDRMSQNGINLIEIIFKINPGF
ncbi:MAG: energy-coupling factor transporter transmembrane protein EcfT [Erysipelotrichaceae bacterium]|jgi:energy-coupling factor transport system permease protein|nr:energy-coupling factor transporter transmembrane component T [Bacilli bacterium]NLV28719.1 energy-coupling factor transporter transmembrane protein EcfT [Erysipelotrichaceae bacterium]HPY79637.1 energy-coupling factor transporter transmembrane component T [Bacilli bacterium]HQA55723.1 energy-coupling factor transporter transmembrane component T [Bacilli bacterium]